MSRQDLNKWKFMQMNDKDMTKVVSFFYPKGHTKVVYL